jgi:signal transduction histidine kinase/DNA-binding response OmpR family regulator
MGVIGQVSAVPETKAPTSATGARVLIVDDDERNAFAAVQALEDLGHELVVAHSGKEALRQLLDGEFAVILLDLHMPEMDGYETARFIRAHPRTKHIPIVFVTAVFRDEAHLFQAYTAGAVDVVFKPVDPFILRSKVSVLVDLQLKTAEVTRQAARLQTLIDENSRVHAEKLAAERALRATQERQEAILKSLPIVIHARAAEAPFAPLFVSEQAMTVCGFAPGRFVDEPDFGFSRVHPEDAGRVAEALRGALEIGSYACEYRWQCADGSYRSFLDRGIAAQHEGGAVLFGSLQDVTDHKTLEEQLAQAQKMEAVGQLTGGVAHDFNNLLTIVMGNADMLIRRTDDESPILPKLQAIRQAAERGQALNRQLLAFARRDRLRSEVTNVDTLIADFLPLMTQAVGEAVTIRAQTAGEELRIDVDPAHLETALLNLAVNARDAMAEGGELTIRTGKVSGKTLLGGKAKGAFVVIEVEDTGSGMPEEVARHVFEPFFTTKEVGKGSGLGLAQVYGFMQQSGGQVRVQSRVGQGTTFQLYLPLTDRPIPQAPTASNAAAVVGGTEELLVVEDDEQVRALTVDMLKGLGYGVVVAPNAKAALALLKSKHHFGALMTDVVMPGGMSGIQLAKTARKLRPDLPILLTSGYAGGQGAADDEFAFLSKPYEFGVLATRLRDLIGEAESPAGQQI